MHREDESCDVANAHVTAGVHDGLTVGTIAQKTGVTVRALHHWDAAGLVSPSERSQAGYRLYSPSDLVRVHRVLIYRELGLSLEQIGDVLGSGSEATLATLRSQREQLDGRIDELQTMRHALDRMIDASEAGIALSAEEQVRIFGETWNPTWARGAREKWGDTEQWARYSERAAARGTQEWEEIADDVRSLDAELAHALNRGRTREWHRSRCSRLGVSR